MSKKQLDPTQIGKPEAHLRYPDHTGKLHETPEGAKRAYIESVCRKQAASFYTRDYEERTCGEFSRLLFRCPEAIKAAAEAVIAAKEAVNADDQNQQTEADSMRLWHLYPREDLPADANPWRPWYDKCFGAVVRAKSEYEARRLAAEQAGDEGPAAWRNPENSLCEPLDHKGTAGVVMRDYGSD